VQNIEHLKAYVCMSSECDWTSRHKISQKCTHMCTNSESGLVTIYKACCTQVGPAHVAGGDGVNRCQHSSHLLLHLRRDWNPVTSTQEPW